MLILACDICSKGLGILPLTDLERIPQMPLPQGAETVVLPHGYKWLMCQECQQAVVDAALSVIRTRGGKESVDRGQGQ